MWKDGDCLVRGVRRVGTAPSCEFGRKRMNAERAKKRSKRT